ncbi:MAG: DinB family protein [Chloroflexi bacterium]|nr:DinB family protein [Chloroflexota bacterium]
MSADQALREQLLALLRGGNAHMNLDHAVADFPMAHLNTRPPNTPYTFWHLIEHLRITQWDILDFVRNPNYLALQWPKEYWPHPDERADEARWNETLRQFRGDLKTMEEIVQNPATDFYSDLPHAKGYNILREVLLVADHNAYHVGELGILRGVMGLWPTNR